MSKWISTEESGLAGISGPGLGEGQEDGKAVWRTERAEAGRQGGEGLSDAARWGLTRLTTGGDALFITTFSATTPDK